MKSKGGSQKKINKIEKPLAEISEGERWQK